jgi:ATP-dependent DNA helicase RecG
MTATPIPRTLAMTLYGDLDVSIIDELPPGRKPITTRHMYDTSRERIFDFMKKEISLGRQIYVVFPLIEESEKIDFQNLQEGFHRISEAFPSEKYLTVMVHGKMPKDERDIQMQLFIEGKAQIMVATTVIEVGVNVPNASVMVIESAERFGLSQLHQLRGRVGRGADQSYCLLVTGVKLSKESFVRLETMERTTDGFEIADVDLRLRGPGDLAGTQQSGVVDLHLTDLSADAKIVELSRHAAKALIAADPNLELPEHLPLLHWMHTQKMRKQSEWRKIS